MTEEIKPPSPRKRPRKRIEKGLKGSPASQKISDAVVAAAKTISLHNVSKPTGGHEPRRQAGEEAMAEKENGSMFEGLSSMGNVFSVEGAKKVAAWYIDTSEKVAKQAIDFQASATKWAKETPLAPIFDAQLEYGKKFVERSASAARSLWRLE
jgi:hypothetical protein